MIILYVLLGVFIGAVAAYVLMDKRLDAAAAESGKKDIALAGCREQLNGATSRAQHLEASAVELNAKIQEKEKENKDIAEWVGQLNAQVATLQRELELVKQQRDDEKVRHEKEVREQKEAHQEDLGKQQKAYQETLNQQQEAMRQYKEEMGKRAEQFENMARKILEENASKLKEQNVESMAGITAPLKESMAEIRKALDDTKDKTLKDSAERTASFKTTMEEMMKQAQQHMDALAKQTQQIGEQAESLTNVLRRDNKVSGNMGEIILGDLLASQGLKEGTHYDVQTRLRDEQGRPMKHEETGKELQPDVILHYPQGQDAIIDSKVSLVAYEKYVNAETPEEKERYLQEHINSVRRHAKELAKKDYSKYIKNGREAVDFVIMFMPFESSLQLALVNDPTLWREAFEQKVFITGEQNLMGILHMIHLAWVQNQQAENQEKVFGLAEQLLERLGHFMEHYNDLGAMLKKAQEKYDDAENKLYAGRQSVTQKGRELIELGAKQSQNPKRRIPEPRENLRLEQTAEDAPTSTEFPTETQTTMQTEKPTETEES